MGDVEKLQNEIDGLRNQLTDLRKNLGAEQKEGSLRAVGTQKDIPAVKLLIKSRKRLNGHFGKIYAFDWAPDSRRLVSQPKMAICLYGMVCTL